jgi:pre-mRNA-splicing factor 38A
MKCDGSISGSAAPRRIMANRTVKDAKTIKGTNPQYLIEKIIRSRIYDSKYWKEECFALTGTL